MPAGNLYFDQQPASSWDNFSQFLSDPKTAATFMVGQGVTMKNNDSIDYKLREAGITDQNFINQVIQQVYQDTKDYSYSGSGGLSGLIDSLIPLVAGAGITAGFGQLVPGVSELFGPPGTGPGLPDLPYTPDPTFGEPGLPDLPYTPDPTFGPPGPGTPTPTTPITPPLPPGAEQPPAPVETMTPTPTPGVPTPTPNVPAPTTAASTAISRILNGTATAADWLSVGVQATPALLGAYASGEQADSLAALVDKYAGYGASSRARFEESARIDHARARHVFRAQEFGVWGRVLHT